MSSDKSSIFSQQNLTAPNLENNYTYEFEDFLLDGLHLMLYKNGKAISLKPKVVETLVALVERPFGLHLADLCATDRQRQGQHRSRNQRRTRKSTH